VLYWAQDPHQSANFFILHECGGALTDLKYFWLTNCLLLMIQKCYAGDQAVIFHMENIALLFI